ncbi:unnamed protein product [Merluccius merluccius]
MDTAPASAKILLGLGLLTLLLPSGNTQSIVKQCASQATCAGASDTAAVDEDGNGNIVNCCNSNDFCNFSGAGTTSIHTFLPVLSLLLLLLVVQ